MPFFALLSAGVPLAGGAELLREPIVIGVVLGLVLGKPIGILGGSWLLTRFTRAELGDELGWRDLAGVAVRRWGRVHGLAPGQRPGVHRNQGR